MNDKEKQALINMTQRVLNDSTRCYTCFTIKDGHTTPLGKCKVCEKRRMVHRHNG